MADNIWINADADNDGNIDNNWSLGNVPTGTDNMKFTAAGVGVTDNCLFSGAISCAGIEVVSDYSGDIDFATFAYTGASGSSVILDGTGIFDCGSSAGHSITAGTLDNKDQTTFTRGISTWTLNGVCTMIGGDSKDYHNLVFASGSTITMDAGNNRIDARGALTISGDVVLDSQLGVEGAGQCTVNAGVTFTGSSIFRLNASDSGGGIVSLDAGVTMPLVTVANASSGAVLAAGTYGGLVKVLSSGASDSNLILSSGTYNFNGHLELQCGSSGTVTLDSSVNGPTINTVDLIIDRNSGAIVIDDSGQAVLWTITGDVIDEAATGFTWTKGTGSVTLSSTANQSCDFMDQDCGQLIILKADGTVDIEAGACELGAVSMVKGLTFTNSTMTASADAKSITGNVDFTDGGNDINLGPATWNITDGAWNTVGAGTWDNDTSTVVFVGTCTINTGTANVFYNLTVTSGMTTVSTNHSQADATIVVNGTLSVDTGRDFYILGTIAIGDGGSFTGAGTGEVHIYRPASAEGVTSFHANGTWDIPLTNITRPNAGAILASGNYQTTFRVQNGSSSPYTLTLDSLGDYQFDSFELETTSSGSLTLANNTNGPTSITVNGNLTFDRDSTGALIINDSGVATNWVITGDVIDQSASGIAWTAGTGTITASGGSAQDWDWMGQTVEAIVVNKTAGTLILSGAVTTTSFTGTDTGTGDFDPNGQTITITGNCFWAVDFDFTAGADTMDSCTWVVGGDFTAYAQSLLATATWDLQVTGRAAAYGVGAVEYCDGDVAGSTEINAGFGPWVDGGNNSNWSFTTSVVSAGLGNFGGFNDQEIYLGPDKNAKILV